MTTPADGWRPRSKGGAAVVPAGNQDATPGAAGSGGPETPKTNPGPSVVDEPGIESIHTLPTPVGAQPPPKEQPKEDRAVLLGAARNAVKQGNFEQAVARYEEYLRRFGDDAAVQREYAGVLFSANRLRQATEQYQRLLNLQPDNLQLRMTLGDIYLANKEYKKASAEFARVLDRAPKNLDAATRLARALALDEDVAHAIQVYERYLKRLQPGDDDVPVALGALLIDLERPADALPFLLALSEKRPDHLEVRADLIRAHVRLGDRAKALALLEELNAKAPRAITVRQTLGDTLYQSGDYDLAGMVYAQILRIDPSNGFARIGTARVAVQMFQPSEARRILAFTPAAPVERIYLLTRAEYHQLIGEYIEAKHIYDYFLGKDPADHEARIALAALQAYVREYEKAKAEYSKVPSDAALGRKARLGFATTLFEQGFHEPAVAACQALLIEQPGNGRALALMARSLVEMHHGPKAESLCRTFLESSAAAAAACRTVRFALAKLLLDTGNYGDAAREYEQLLAQPAARVPAAYYGLARALDKLGDHAKSQQVLASIISPLGGDFRARLMLADLYSGDNEDPPTVEMCLAVLKWDKQNLAALIRLADAQQRLARFSGRREEAVRTAETVLALSPPNVRGHLALARSYASTEKYREAAVKYERLIALDPAFAVPERERARVLFSDHQFRASAAAYQEMLVPAAEEKLLLNLASFAQKEPKLRGDVDLLAHAELPPDALRAESAKLVAGVPDPEIQAALQRILADYDARTAEQIGARLEGEAKDLKDFRSYAAISVYQALLAHEPHNEEALFDLGQVYGVLKQTHREIEQYGQLLHVDPLHREGIVASERASLELQPNVQFNVDFFADKGRDGLARIQRTRYQSWIAVPWGDENELVQFGFAPVHYQPHIDPALDGTIISGRVQHKWGEKLLLFGQLNYENYPNRISDKFTFDAGAQYDFSDLVRGWSRAFLQNVVENGVSIRQDIFRGGGDLGLGVRPTRYWDFGGDARVAYYSDVNTLGELYLFNNVLLSLPPRQLKFVLDADLQAFAQSTVFADNIRDDQHILIHPYFSPRAYAYYEARLEWTQWLSRDYFVHSNQCYYSLQYANGWDSNLVNYNSFRALANFDIKPWLTVGADSQGVLSSAYNSIGANAYLIVRFPCGCLRK